MAWYCARVKWWERTSGGWCVAFLARMNAPVVIESAVHRHTVTLANHPIRQVMCRFVGAHAFDLVPHRERMSEIRLGLAHPATRSAARGIGGR